MQNNGGKDNHNSPNTCPNGADEEFMGMYAMNTCQWIGHLINQRSDNEVMEV